MVGWRDFYKVVEKIVPMYFMSFIGYFSSLGDEAHNIFSKLLYYFVLPSLAFKLTSNIDPFHVNIHFLYADLISKFLILVCLAFWANRFPNGSYDWSITCFSLSSLTNSVIIGVPFMEVMYGKKGVDLVVQGSAFQAIVWLTGLLFILEYRRAHLSARLDIPVAAEDHNRPSFYHALVRNVLPKLARNPNSYACIIGLSWAFLANRCHIKMPKIVEDSVGIMSDMGIGSAMFNMGIFMAAQTSLMACGARETIIGMVLKFIGGPVAMAIASIAMRLHDDVLRVAIIQAAIPLSITSFIYAHEYDLDPTVLSTAVILGAFLSLPVLIAYYAFLEFVRS